MWRCFGAKQCIPLGRVICLGGTLCVACMGPSVLVGTLWVHWQWGWPLAQLAVRPAPCAGCWAAAKQGQVLVWLHMELWGRGWDWRRPTGWVGQALGMLVGGPVLRYSAIGPNVGSLGWCIPAGRGWVPKWLANQPGASWD